ncbi:MAG: prephenate dehydrogenase [Actinomycetales bacterium]|nr:prephenate dehydrogenase [Actinomycetales bacterium]
MTGPLRTAVEGPVLVVGTGLIGTSIALSLRRAGVEVLLDDVDPAALRTAVEMGAGRALDSTQQPAHTEPGARSTAGLPQPMIVLVAVPPLAAAEAVARACERYPDATITDVSSVKAPVLEAAAQRGADMARVVGGHPMAGREVSGAAGARADLLDDRWWILTPCPTTQPARVDAVRRLVQTCGAVAAELSPQEHDRAVALVSHAPQVLSSVLAGELLRARPAYVQIAGQGLRDMTRIAGSSSALWTEILAANAEPVVEVLSGVMERLGRALEDLRSVVDGQAGAIDGLTQALVDGAQGRALIPGKHGAAPLDYAEVAVMVADRPGELARLFVAAGEAGINLEDVRIEHVLGRPSGLVELSVRPAATEPLITALRARGFDVRGWR